MNEQWFVLNINPEPWAVGPLGVARREGKLAPYMGRNQQLDAYKEAVRDELITRYPTLEMLPPGYELDFYFWRNRADYQGTTKQVRKNQADATNMQKATEDALQGLLIENDRDVLRVGSAIMAQGPDVRGAVAFRVRYGVTEIKGEPLPEDVMQLVADLELATPTSSNEWPPRG